MPVTYDLSRFNTRSFSTSDAHVPPGGLGCFSATYNPRSGAMKVAVKVAARFIDPLGQPVPLATQTNMMQTFKQGRAKALERPLPLHAD
jgi:hypothetical protein